MSSWDHTLVDTVEIGDNIDPHPLLLALVHDKRFPRSETKRRVDVSRSQTKFSLTSDTGLSVLLDAIASVCLSEASGQVTATSLTLDKDGRTVVLCIAQTEKVSDKTVEFLGNLWRLLSTMASQNKAHLSETWSMAEDLQEDITNTMGEIFTLCYRHSHAKWKRRIMKRKDDFQMFLDVGNKDGSGPEEPPTLFKNLSSYLLGAMGLLDCHGELSASDYLKISRKLGRASLIYRDLLENKTAPLAKWNREHTKKVAYEFDLERYLRKCFLLHSSIWTLFEFALSPRLFIFFGRNLRITPIDPEEYVHKPPVNHEEWKLYMAKVFKAARIEFNPEAAEEIKSAPSYGNAPIHCEALLLAYHHRQLQAGSIAGQAVSPPLNYIGCTKLSCYACGKFFEAYNKPSKEKGYVNNFSTRESHSKFKYPCAIPDLGDDKSNNHVRKEFFLQLCSDYGDLLRYLRDECLDSYGAGALREALYFHSLNMLTTSD